MKKTMHSLMTAAVFAATVSAAAGGTVLAELASAENDITVVPQTTYGPPALTRTTEEADDPLVPQGEMVVYPIEETTTATNEEVALAGDIMPYVTTAEQELELAGEPVIFSEKGDLNFDGSLDARDVSLLKQYLLANGDVRNYANNLDVNLDGKIDKQDAKALIRLLTGRPEEEDGEETQVTTLPTIPPLPETTTDVTSPTYMVLYGPPPAWN